MPSLRRVARDCSKRLLQEIASGDCSKRLLKEIACRVLQLLLGCFWIASGLVLPDCFDCSRLPPIAIPSNSFRVLRLLLECFGLLRMASDRFRLLLEWTRRIERPHRCASPGLAASATCTPGQAEAFMACSQKEQEPSRPHFECSRYTGQREATLPCCHAGTLAQPHLPLHRSGPRRRAVLGVCAQVGSWSFGKDGGFEFRVVLQRLDDRPAQRREDGQQDDARQRKPRGSPAGPRSGPGAAKMKAPAWLRSVTGTVV